MNNRTTLSALLFILQPLQFSKAQLFQNKERKTSQFCCKIDHLTLKTYKVKFN